MKIIRFKKYSVQAFICQYRCFRSKNGLWPLAIWIRKHERGFDIKFHGFTVADGMISFLK